MSSLLYYQPNQFSRLVIDCTLSQSDSCSSLSSSSSTTSQQQPQQQQQPLPLCILSAAKIKPSDCLSGDEGYVGSFTEQTITDEDESPSENLAQLPPFNSLFRQICFAKYIMDASKPGQPTEDIQIPKLFEMNEEEEPAGTCSLNDSNIIVFYNETGLFDVGQCVGSIYNDGSFFTVNNESEEMVLGCGCEPQCSGQCVFRVSEAECVGLALDVAEIKNEEFLAEEYCMKSPTKWRKVAAKINQRDLFTKQCRSEDTVDLKAYLNEIELNVEHARHDPASCTLNDAVDTFLAFRDNQLSFNVHQLKQKVEQPVASTLAQINVDEIQEFRPIWPSDEPTEDLGEMIEMVDESSTHFYLGGNSEYEDYEDQVYLDSLTEEEALDLLRTESELYALEMAQASKSGVLLNVVDDENGFDMFGYEVECDEELEETSEEQENDSTLLQLVEMGDEIELNEMEQDDLEEEKYANTYYPYDFSDLDYRPEPSQSPSSVSMSLRNSLLKLRQSRRHLATLVEQSSSSETTNEASSTQSSLTTNSNMSLYKKHIESQMSRKPCVYMLNEGRCLRSDCRFVHDLKSITCKYWLEGECLKGDENCEFLHAHVAPTPASLHKSSRTKGQSGKGKLNNVVVKKKDFKLDTEEFPALGGQPAAVNQTTSTPGSVQTSATTLFSNVAQIVKTPPLNIATPSNKLNETCKIVKTNVKTTTTCSMTTQIKEKKKTPVILLTTSSKPTKTPSNQTSLLKKSNNNNNKANKLKHHFGSGSCSSSNSSLNSVSSSRANSVIRKK